MLFFWKSKKDTPQQQNTRQQLEKEPIDFQQLFSDSPNQQSNELVQGELTPAQILLLSYYEKLKSGTELARFWKNKYGIDNIDAQLKIIEDKGFADGVKLTSKGEEFKGKHEWVLYIHRNIKSDDVTMESMAQLVNEYPQRRWQDLMWGCFNERLLDYANSQEYGRQRNVYFQMAKFLDEVENDSEEAIQYYAETLFCDLNNNPITHDPMTAIAPGMVSCLRKMERKLNYTEKQLINLFQRRFENSYPVYDNYSNDAVTFIATCYALGYDDRAERMIYKLHPIKKERN